VVGVPAAIKFGYAGAIALVAVTATWRCDTSMPVPVLMSAW
jgi:hypothetical protein